MYIKTKLVKAFNELYYRNYQDTKIEPITTDIKLIDIALVSDTLNEVMIENDIDLYADEHSLFAILEDIVAVELGYKPSFSVVGKTAFDALFSASMRATDKIFPIDQKGFHVKSFYEVVKTLQKSKNSALVGGCVRDALIGKTPKDFDFVTSIPMDELKVMFKEAGFKVQEEGKQFLVLIVSKDGEQYEIANYRQDNYRKKPKYVRRIKSS